MKTAINVNDQLIKNVAFQCLPSISCTNCFKNKFLRHKASAQGNSTCQRLCLCVLNIGDD